MDERPYKYDVAFSFLASDEGLATELNDLLQDRFSTFLYSERQREIAGTDGEKSFNEAFGGDARVVVVLYRARWGQTPWTRIEETAIRNRAHEEGYDFSIFIPLDKPPTVPRWLPKTRLYVGLERWGTTGAAAVIEERIRSFGGAAREETATDRALRLERANAARATRQRLMNSYEGVEAADNLFVETFDRVESEAASITSKTSIKLDSKKSGTDGVILGKRRAMSIDWIRQFANALTDASLDVAIWNGHPPRLGAMLFKKSTRLALRQYAVDISPTNAIGWAPKDQPERHLSPEELARELIKWLLDEEDSAAAKSG